MIPYFELVSIEVGGAPVYVFGLCLMAGWVVGGLVTVFLAFRRGHVLGPLVMFGALPFVGLPAGHLVYLIAFEPFRLTEPQALLNVTYGNSAGGALLAVGSLGIGAAALVRRSFWETLDVLTTGGLILLGFYRLGSSLVHDHPGTATSFPLAIQGVCFDRHPTRACHDLGFYELLWVAFVLVASVALRERHAPGGRLALVALSYPLLRWVQYPITDPQLMPGTAYIGLEAAVLVGLLATGGWLAKTRWVPRATPS